MTHPFPSRRSSDLRYRHVVERLARRGKLDECDVALGARRLAREAAGEEGGDDIRAHVGWYLADAGVPQLERDLGLRRGPLASIRSGWRHTPLLAYILPIAAVVALFATGLMDDASEILDQRGLLWRSEEHTSELQSIMRISYAVF